MCIGIPMQLVAVEGPLGWVEEGGVRQRVSLALLDEVSLGDYLLVHAGFAISRLDPEEAQETRALLEQAGLLPGGSGA